MASQEHCDIPDIRDEAITSYRSSISERGQPNVTKIGVDLNDELDKKTLTYIMFDSRAFIMSKQYTVPSYIRK